MRERHKRDIVLKTDPVTNEKYWSNEVVTVYKPDEEDRLNAVLDILKGEKTAEEVRKKFDIATVNSVYTWIGKYVTQEKALSLEEQTDEEDIFCTGGKPLRCSLQGCGAVFQKSV